MAGAIAVQQHDDVVNLSTISHKKTGYRFAFGKYVIQVSLWHLFRERSSFFYKTSLKRRLYECSKAKELTDCKSQCKKSFNTTQNRLGGSE